MMALLDGIGKVVGKISENIQGRTERLKNEKFKLQRERRDLMAKEFTPYIGRRVADIDNRLCTIQAILENAA